MSSSAEPNVIIMMPYHVDIAGKLAGYLGGLLGLLQVSWAPSYLGRPARLALMSSSAPNVIS